jgi:hypothetical protein
MQSGSSIATEPVTAATEEIPTCPVCIEKYTKVRREVECPKCQNTACHRCTQRYICETIEDPHCMHCKHPYDRQFLNSNLTKTFMSGEYVQKRREILWNREESYLPAAMAFIPLKKERETFHSKRNELNKLIRELEHQLSEISDREYAISRAIDTGVLPGAGTTAIKEAQQKFVRRCIKDACKGWLSTAWKCDICESKVCSDCYQIKQETPTHPHICKKEDLETAEYIRKNAKNCPNCGEMIEKKEGCDQMFCTSCHTAFSWKTLEIVKGAIHNPHYFAWRQAQGVNERTIGDIQCGGVPDQALFNFYSDLRHQYHVTGYDIDMKDVFDNMETPSHKDVRMEKIDGTTGRRTYNNYYAAKITPAHKIYMVFTNICRHLEHMRSYTQRYGSFYYDEEERAKKLRHMRLDYLSDHISKEQFKVFLSNEEKKREKLTILSQPIDTLYNAGADILRRAIPSVSNVGVDMSKPENRTPENYNKLFAYGKRHIDEYQKLVEFINGIYKDISLEFNVKVPQIDRYCHDDMINFCKAAREERKEGRKKASATIRSVADHDSDSDY